MSKGFQRASVQNSLFLKTSSCLNVYNCARKQHYWRPSLENNQESAFCWEPPPPPPMSMLGLSSRLCKLGITTLKFRARGRQQTIQQTILSWLFLPRMDDFYTSSAQSLDLEIRGKGATRRGKKLCWRWRGRGWPWRCSFLTEHLLTSQVHPR